VRDLIEALSIIFNENEPKKSVTKKNFKKELFESK